MARPRKQIDAAVVQRMATHQCSNVEIAAAVGCDESTIRARFPDELASWRELGKTRLRDMQWRSAAKGSVPMQIFLGKQCLGQSEKVNAAVEIMPVPYDPIAVFASNPELREKALQQERDIADAQARLALDSRSANFPRLAVPKPPPSSGAGGNGTADKSRPE